MPTRETCVSTGTSCRPKANSSTQAAVLRPTPGSAHEVRLALGDGHVAQPARSSAVRLVPSIAAQDRLDARAT